eukprot:GFUD01041734.1.p1 GENE.GFUD01041734.1~~GFUD01041734.1.p1  ORF type:complete len:1462 (+),score=564.73 GFUD01041734.1:87-4472(+)
MAPSVEVDLTSPPKKMKQARLPFAPVNKQVSKDLSESGRKRKHSEEDTVTPNKNPKKDVKSPVKPVKIQEESKEGSSLSTDSKEKVASFAKDNQENNPDAIVDEVKNTTEANSESKTVEVTASSKKKITKAKKEKPQNKNESNVDEGLAKFKGLLKMPFKKSKKGDSKKSKVQSDNGIVVELSTAEPSDADKSAMETPTEETSMTSMTDEWAKFHENRETADESMEEVETSQTGSESGQTPKSSKKKTIAEKEKEKEERLKIKLEEKARKDEEKAKAKAEKEKRKSLVKEEKEKNKDDKTKLKKEKTPKKGMFPVDDKEKELDNSVAKEETKEIIPEQNSANEEVQSIKKKENTPAKVNPLAKFLVKSKGGETNPKQTAEPKISHVKKTMETEVKKNTSDEDIQVIGEVKASPATSTPLRSSPRKKVSLTKTPSTPFTPDPDRVKKLKIAKLKVKISELNMRMDKAVEEKDFLKAHETKQAIQKLEEEVKEIDADTSYVSQSLSDVSAVASSADNTSADNTPKVTPKATPKNTRNVSVVTTPGSAQITPLFKKLTPGQHVKQEEMKKKREALEKEKQTKKEALEKEKQAKKEALEKEKADKERVKEVEKRAKDVEKLEKERIRKAEKDKLEAEKEKQKQEREEERLKKKAEKDAELKQKEEERLKKEEEKKFQEEAEKEKVKKKAQAFKSFFKKEDAKERKLSGEEVQAAEVSLGNFTVFRVKNNMRLAPMVRNDPEKAKKRIDSLDMPSGPDGLYLAVLKTNYTPGKQTRTWPYEKNAPKGDDDDVEILEDEEEEESDPEDVDAEESNDSIVTKEALAKVPRAKLLQFHANQRPAYWGTFTKKSAFISGRRPFGKDEDRFEYDYDSDEDWEEEEEGESLSDNEDDKEKEEEKDDYEVDNEFFVPHGYLSDEEEEKDEDEVFNPETAKEKLKHAEKEFEKEHKKKTQQLKPRLWGVCFEGETLDTGAAASQLVKILGGFQGIIIGNNNCIETGFSKPVLSPTALCDETTDSAKVKNSSKGAKAKTVPEEAVPDLIKLLHGNTNNKMFLAREFIEFWKKSSEGEDGAGDSAKVDGENVGTPGGKDGHGTISKRKMIDKIQEVADYKRQTEGGVRCWWVKEDVLTKYSVTPGNTNEWSYILEQPNNKSSTLCPLDDLNASRPGSPSMKVAASPNPASLITKFARVLTEEEKEEQRVKQEKEALLARLKREAAKAEQAAKEAKFKVEQAAAVQLETEAVAKPSPTCAKPSLAGVKPSPAGAMTKFTKVLSTEEHKARLAKGSSPVTGKKRVALTQVTQASPIASKRANSTPLASMSPGNVKRATLTPVAKLLKKKNPITALATGKDLTSPQTKIASPIAIRKTQKAAASHKIASPILVKKTPGSGAASPAPGKKGLKISTPEAINAKASPIAIKRKPGTKVSTPLSFKGKIGSPSTIKTLPPGISVTTVRCSPRKKVVECVTLD